jgi:DNA recombination protein RmuC
VLRTVASLWRQEQQKHNVEEIARRGAELYNKLAGFVADFTEMGKRLEQAQTSYSGALAKLHTGSGNVIRQAEMLKTLGVKPTKQIPQGLIELAQQETLELEDQPELP